jgi:hypothetical protein
VEFKNKPINCSACEEEPIGTDFDIVNLTGAHIKVGFFPRDKNLMSKPGNEF